MLPRATGLQPKQYARPFDQNLGSPLIYFFYVHPTMRPKYMVLFHLFFLQCTTIRPKIRVHIDLFFYLHTTIRPNHRVLFHLFYSFFTARQVPLKVWVFIDIFLSFAHDHSTKIYDLLSFIYSFFVHDHSTKKQGPH